MIIHNSKLVPKGFTGITLYPFIFLKDSKEEIIKKKGIKKYNIIINHEKIHLKQQLELLVVFFYIVYIGNYLVNIFKGLAKPYRNIIFEKEAYSNEENLGYLENRKIWSWLKYNV